ncbi:MAG: TatD family hydrolase, partial [Coriobacteriales bacterium]
MSLSDFKSFDARDAVFRNSKGKQKAAPELPQGAPVADTHCHLGMLDDVPLALARAAAHGVAFIECITDPAEQAQGEVWSKDIYTCLDGWRADARTLLAEWDMADAEPPAIRMACGVHPHNARDWECGRPILEELLTHPATSCLGEIGLDYHYDKSPREDQRRVFALQLNMAHELGLPVSLHIREAHDEALQILKREGVPQAGCILHCFNLGPADLEPFAELGCFVALGGPLTFKKECGTRAAVALVSPERLLTETDAPFMAPEPLRGVACEPAHTAYTLRMLLDCLGYAGEERALELMSPRPMDLPEGEEPRPLLQPSFSALRGGLDELGMCRLLYRNAVQLLDRPNPARRTR